MARGESYDEFVEKFKPKLTTDDCYTPGPVYDAVAGWVAEEYGLDRADFVRPFWPGGDFEAFYYPAGCCVVDNPPFSIQRRILEFFVTRGIRFFLFTQGTTAISSTCKYDICAVGCGVQVTYENGAEVNTAFLTNLDTAAARSAPELYKRVKAANDYVQRQVKKQLQKYKMPDHVLTGSMLNYMSIHDTEFRVEREDTYFIRRLDAMKEAGKDSGIYGAALLLSEKAAAEKAAAEKAAAEKAAATVWELSEREKQIVRNLSGEHGSGAAYYYFYE